MKKLLSALLVLGASQAAIANTNHSGTTYNGWSLGASVGWVGSSFDMNTGLSDIDGKMKFNATGFGVHADWATSKTNGLFFGLGLGLGYHAGNPSHKLFEGTKTGNGVTVTGTVSLKQKRKFYLELPIRLGMNLGNSVIYGLVAFKGTQVEYELSGQGSIQANGVTENINGSASRKDFILAVGPGIGFDFKIAKNWSAGFEYKYFFEKSVSALQIKSDAKQRSHNVVGRLSYHF